MRNFYINLTKLGIVFFCVLLGSQILMAQTGGLKGVVADENDNRVPAANIQVSGTSLGTVTDDKGVFQLQDISIGVQTIEVSFIGYQTQSKEITIVEGKNVELSFVLKDDYQSLGEIVVTASKRSERIQDVPQSISAISGKGLEQMGATDMRDYIEALPGVKLQSPNPIENDISIRGIAPMAGWSSTIGYYINETPVTESGLNPAISSYDMERVEVLRGPQGTLYGEGSMGGTIKMISNKPNVNNTEFRFDPEFSNTSKGGSNYNVNGMLNIPVIKNKLALRATGFYRNDDGYIKNIGIGEDKVNTYETYGGRIAARYIASKKLFFTASAIFSSAKIGGQFVANENYEQNTSVRENMNDNYAIYNLSAYYNFSFADLTVTGSYYQHTKDQVVDLGFIIPTADYLFGLVGEGPFDGIWTNSEAQFNVYTAEARLVSSGKGPFKWTTGLFYKNYDMKGSDIGDSDPHISQETVDMLTEAMGLGEFGIQGIFLSDSYRKVQQSAVFGELSYDITSKLNVLAGVRLFNEKRDFSNTSDGLFPVLQTGLPPETVSDKGDATMVNPKFTLTYKPSHKLLTYATASKGFRSGGQNLFAFMFEGAPTSYGPESLWNYELGLKSSLLNGKLIANAALFYNSWTDMQLRTRSLASLDVVENVGKAHTAGVDAEITWMPVKGLSFVLGANLTKAETDVEITLPAGFDEDTGEELFDKVEKGAQLPFVPDYGYDVAAQYRFPVSKKAFVSTRLSYNYTGKSTTALVNAEENPAYGSVNLRVSTEYKWLEAYIYVDNLMDEQIRQAYWYDDPTLGTIYAMGRPRTIGIGLRAKF